MSQCQTCSAPTDTWLCKRHATELRTILEDMPWWLEMLTDAAVGHVKLGDGGGGRTTARREPFKGDDGALARCKCGHPEHEGQPCEAVDREVIVSENIDDGTEIKLTACMCVEYQPIADQAKIRAQFLAAGGVNARASARIDLVRNTITTWLRRVCDQHRTDWVTFIDPHPNEPTGFIGPLLPGWTRGAPTPFIGPLLPGQFRRYTYPAVNDACHWLAWNVTTIARTDAAGQCLADFQDHVTAIEKVINRPIPMRYLGKCPTWNEHTRKVCGTELRCREGIIEVTCKVCRRTHNADRLQLLMMMDLEREKVTVGQILELNRRLPEEYRIPERTLRRWRKPGPNGEPAKLKIRGYRRGGPNGPLVINRHSDDDEPVYLWADVRRLRAEKPEKARAR